MIYTDIKIKGFIEKLQKPAIYLFFVFLFLLFAPPQFDLEIEINGVEGEGSILLYKAEKGSILDEYFTEWHSIDSETGFLFFTNLHYDLQDLRIDVDGVKSVDFNKITLYSGNRAFKQYKGEDISRNLKTANLLDTIEVDDAVRFIRSGEGDSFFVLEFSNVFDFSFLIWYLLPILFVSYLSTLFFLFLFETIKQENLFFMFPLCEVLIVTYLSLLVNGSLEIVDEEYLKAALIIHSCIYMFFISVLDYSTGTLLSSIFISAFYIINFFVEAYRGRSFLLTDFLAARTALSVLGKYDFTLSIPVFLLIVFCLLQFIFLRSKRQIDHRLGSHKKCLLLVCSVLFLALLHGSTLYKNAKFFAWDADIVYFYKKQGLFLSMAKYKEEFAVNKPSGYSQDIALNILNEAKVDSNTSTILFNNYGNRPDNILMIMNESLSNIEQYNNDLCYSATPYLDSITKNIIRGNIFVSVRGGGTCNTEFESLTGLSMSFLPLNAYPFQMYLSKDVPSLPRYLAENGYSISSLHPENRNNWNRNSAYRFLGLFPFYAIDDLQNIETIRGSATDRYDYEQIIRIVNENESDKTYMFNVTMQNHGGYQEFDDLEKTIDLSDYGVFPTAEVYLSLTKLSDDAIFELMDYYEKCPSKTMIVIYGDHQPSLGTETDEWIMKDSSSPLDKYCVPFYIWTNYPIESRNVGNLSANYIPYLVAEASGQELSAFYRFLGTLYDKIPVMTQFGFLDKNGQYYETVSELPDEEKELIHKYSIVQYDILFGNGKIETYVK